MVRSKRRAGQTAEEYSAYLKVWRAKNPEYMKTYMKSYRAKNIEKILVNDRVRGKLRPPSARRKEWLKDKYGITLGQFMEMAEAQGQKCPLCDKICARSEKPQSGFHVDHDHQTGVVRGLLCGPCNRRLGQLGDSVAGVELFLSRVRAYLERT